MWINPEALPVPALAVCGFSGSGKTTLLRALVERLSACYRIGYIKHDAHRFAMDHPGKDTDQLYRAGAEQVLINDGDHYAVVSRGGLRPGDAGRLLPDCDFLLVEGYKNSALPKVVMLDDKGAILQAGIDNILAVSGPVDPGPVGYRWIHRDRIDELAELIVEQVYARARRRPLHGLVLAGGHSRRMGRDKALLDYHGVSQVEHSLELLQPFCEDVRISVRRGQQPTGIDGNRLVEDAWPDMGPLGGVLAAMGRDTAAAWLVVACDMPLLDRETLAALLAARDPLALATCFRGWRDGPEPLCAIYEPRCFPALLGFMTSGGRSLRRFLEETGISLAEPPGAETLVNINDPAGYKAVRQRLQSSVNGGLG